MEWTPEKEQKFWERCGFRYYDKAIAETPAGDFIIPDITDLNALFKYAVPKVKRWEMGSCPNDTIFAIVCQESRFPSEAVAETPALALAEAIEKALEATDG